MTETKPKVFQDIDNAIVNLKVQFGQEMGSALSELTLSIERGHVVERKAAECEKTVIAFETLLKKREE